VEQVAAAACGSGAAACISARLPASAAGREGSEPEMNTRTIAIAALVIAVILLLFLVL
jgi:hypothetical protein